MQLTLTTILTALSAGAHVLPAQTTDESANITNVRNGLPYSNFDPYNHTLPYNTSASANHTSNNSDNYTYHSHHTFNKTSSSTSTSTSHNNENTTTLHPRAPKGHKLDADIASYTDASCTITASPKVYLALDACVKFSPLLGTNIGINWGGSPLVVMTKLQTFTDDDCRVYGPKVVSPGSLGMSGKGAGSCKAYSEFLKVGAEWKSVWMTA
jgi:hypothetical protein